MVKILHFLYERVYHLKDLNAKFLLCYIDQNSLRDNDLKALLNLNQLGTEVMVIVLNEVSLPLPSPDQASMAFKQEE